MGRRLEGAGWERADKLPEFIAMGQPQLVKSRQIARAETRLFPEASPGSRFMPRDNGAGTPRHAPPGFKTW